VAARALENEWGGQSRHAAHTLSLLNLPLAQATHAVASSALAYPAMHEQADALPLASGDVFCTGHPTQTCSDAAPSCSEKDPALQFEHGADPISDLYFPATHSTQDAECAPENPALHAQASPDVSPVTAECEPSGHAVQAAAAVSALYVPGTHA